MTQTIDDSAILAVVREAAKEEAEIPPELIVPASNAAAVPGWDSLAHTRIIMNIEERLDVQLDMNATMQTNTFGDLLNVIRSALTSRGSDC